MSQQQDISVDMPVTVLEPGECVMIVTDLPAPMRVTHLAFDELQPRTILIGSLIAHRYELLTDPDEGVPAERLDKVRGVLLRSEVVLPANARVYVQVQNVSDHEVLLQGYVCGVGA